MIISQSGIVDIIPEYNRALRPIFCVSEGDADSRMINLTVKNAGELFTIPEGANVYVAGKKLDNTIFTYECSYSGYIVTFPITEQMSAVSGLVLCEIQIVVAGDPLGSANFCFWVEPSPIENGTTSESDLNIFVQAISDLGGYEFLTDEVAVLSARMDQFARLPDGSLSTAADAELVDIRVKANGTTAATAGDAVREQVGGLNIGINDIKDIENIIIWNLIDAENILDGGLISEKGDINTAYTDWSYTGYIAVNPSTTYTQYSNAGGDVDISGGIYIAQYDAEKTFIQRDAGNKLTVTTTATTAFVRLSVKTAYKEFLVFGKQKLRLSVPTKHFNNTAFVKNAVNWNSGYLVLASGSSISRLANADWKTTDYVFLNKGTYYVTPTTAGGGYITVYNTDLVPLSNTAVVGGQYGEVTLDSDSYVTVSVRVAQDVSLISETQYLAIIAAQKAENAIAEGVGLFADKKICFYGDSITCLGNDFRAASWQGILKDYFKLTKGISVGIGGSHIKWTANERYDLSSFTLGNNLPYGATRTTGDTGTIASLCSWERIEKTVPTDCDIVFIMGGTNDVFSPVDGDTEMSADNLTDTAWTASGDYIGGDYDITKINGAVLSIIMKLHVRCPNALIVWCTPLSGRGQTSGANQLNYGENDNTYDIAKAIVSMCDLMSCECFNLYGGAGITPYNRATYLYDTVHPNAAGMKMIGRFLIEKFRSLYPALT